MPAAAAETPRVLLMPLTIHAPQDHHAFLKEGLRSMFVSRLANEGLDVMSEEAAAGVLQEADRDGIESDERAEALTRRSGAGYGIYGSVTTLGGGYSLDLALVDLTKTPPKLTRISEATNQEQLIPKLADVAYRFRAVIEGVDPRRFLAAAGGATEDEDAAGLLFQSADDGHTFQPTGYTSVRMNIVSFDVGDLEGDGTSEIVIISRSKLVIAKRDSGTLAMQDVLNVGTGEEFLRVSVGDADRDGRSEIYLVSLYGKRAQTTAYHWDGEFRERFRMPGHLNAVRDVKIGKTVLLFQNSKLEQLFSGDIHRMELEGQGKPARKEKIPFEEGAQLYTLAFADINRDAVGEFLGLQEGGYLCVWDPTGTLLWQGTTKLEGSNNQVTLGARPSPGQEPTPIELTGRVMAADLDRDGRREVIAAHNLSIFDILERFRIYKESRILAYKTESSAVLSKTWVTRKINYAIADLQVDGTTLYVVGQKGRFSKMGTGSSRIMWFE